MINKISLLSTINKYYLGENESVKWSIKNKTLTVDFMSINREVIGKVQHYNFPLEDCDLAIFDTKKLINLLNITLGDVVLEIEKTRDIYTKLNISDKDFNLTYALADPLLIQKVGKVSEVEWECTIPLEAEHISNLIKAKSALAEIDNMIITTEEDEDNGSVCKFTFGDEQGHNNKITYQLVGDISNLKINLPFNSNHFKNILSSNKDFETGYMYLNSKGLMKLEFTTENWQSTYYIVRKEQTSF